MFTKYPCGLNIEIMEMLNLHIRKGGKKTLTVDNAVLMLTLALAHVILWLTHFRIVSVTVKLKQSPEFNHVLQCQLKSY